MAGSKMSIDCLHKVLSGLSPEEHIKAAVSLSSREVKFDKVCHMLGRLKNTDDRLSSLCPVYRLNYAKIAIGRVELTHSNRLNLAIRYDLPDLQEFLIREIDTLEKWMKVKQEPEFDPQMFSEETKLQMLRRFPYNDLLKMLVDGITLLTM
uniref:Uncharacterized protein n=1 Tax=Ditylenchus dipsaci TaxID=166011 RepID=A0A915DCN9_9BILA